MEHEIDDVKDVDDVVSDGKKGSIFWNASKLLLMESMLTQLLLLVESNDFDGGEGKTNDCVDSILSENIFVSDEDVEFTLKKVNVSNNIFLTNV
ncbi:hypothetical protein Tco_1562447 [Tanacetum coccineum]